MITKVMRVSGAETTSVCASMFIGQIEVPLTIKPYIKHMTAAELMTVMIDGMARIAGSVIAACVGLLGRSGREPMNHGFHQTAFLLLLRLRPQVVRRCRPGTRH